MHNLLDLMNIVDKYITYLKENNFQFDDDGFPIFKKEMFLEEEPELIVPYSNRNDKRVRDKKKVVLCTFTPDEKIYTRFQNLFLEIDIYKEYLGVVTADVTVTEDMDIEWQELIVLLNQLYGAVLAINGVKLILNTRLGSIKNIKLFMNYPRNIMCVSSFLGCKKDNKYDYSYLSKILNLRPSKLLIYGKEDKLVNLKLDTMGIDYRYYIDFHRLCKGGIDNV
jgi:hypothetical protein